jgi:hypothetical protein
MRMLSLTVFLFVAIQGIATASTAFASPTAVNASVQADTRSSQKATRFDVDEKRVAPSQRAKVERASTGDETQVLSKDYPQPKPVHIYWFFGGR